MVKLNKVLLGGVSMLAMSSVIAPALAQSADNSGIETVVVTGIRASLRNSQQIKKAADVFVDSITAEDIGALPDRSVTESLQRIPGVSINRFAGSGDPDHFSAEGSGVVVRGLSYVRSEINGRDTFSANNGRELSFSDVPSELLSGVDVFKSPSADMVEGGLSGTVNLRTRVPFDSDGRVIAGSIEGSYGDFVDKWKPTGAVLASDRWATGAGEFGLLVTAVDSQIATRADNIQADYFNCRTDLGGGSAKCPTSGGGTAPGVWFPSGGNISSQDFNRERIGYGGAGQWQSNDGTLLATLQFLRSDSREAWTEHRVEIASDVVTDQGGSRPVNGTTFDFDSDGVFTDGVITGPTGWRDDGGYNWRPGDCSGGGCDPRSPAFGLQSNNHRRDVLARFVTSDAGGNLKWTPNDSMAFNLDFQHVDSSVSDNDVEINTSSYQNASLDLRGDLPILKFTPPGLNPGQIGGTPCTVFGPPGQTPYPQPAGGDPQSTCTTYMANGNTSFSDPNNSFWRSAMDHLERSTGKENSARLDFDYKFQGNSWLELARVGYRWSERDQVTRSSTYNWGVLSEQWGNGGPVWLNDPVDGIHDPNGYPTGGGSAPTASEQTFAFHNYFRGQTPLPIQQPYLFSAINGAKNYSQYAAFANSIVSEWAANPLRHTSGSDGWVPLNNRVSSCDAKGMVHLAPDPRNPANLIPTYPTDPASAGTIAVKDCEPGFTPSEVSPSTETTQALYAMLKFGHNFGEQSLDGNVGVRWFQTNHSTTGALQFPADNLPREIVGECLPDPSNPGYVPPPFCDLPAATKDAARSFANGDIVAQSAKLSYSYFLPSLNLKYNLNDQMLLRFGVSKTISRPPMGETRINNTTTTAADQPVSGVNEWGGFQTTTSNPFLKPVRATSYDLSYEWYFAPAGSFTVAAFYKELNGVITQETTSLFPKNPLSGTAFDVLTTTPVNSDKTGKVKGLEFAYQQFYDFLPKPFDGFGINANYTYIESQGVPQNTFNVDQSQSNQVPTVDTSLLPLEQLSKHNVNIAGIYEKGPISARIAYNWRSKFLLTAYDVIRPHAPIFNLATGQLDGSIFYSVNDDIKVGVEGSNLLDEVLKTTQVLNNSLLEAPRSWYINDRRVSIIIRAQY